MAEKTLTQQAIDRLVRREDYTADEMSAVISEIMQGQAGDAQIAAFLVALRMKGESIDEIFGAVRAMREHAVKISPSVPVFDTCGTGGDGTGTFNVSTATAFVVAGAGMAVAKHGNRSVSSRCGSADVLEALGVNLEMTPQQVTTAIEDIGIGFLFAPRYHGAMKYAAPARREIGIRSLFNILGPLSNPAGAAYQLLGVYHAGLVAPLAHVLQKLGLRGAMVVHGADGLDELTLTGASHIAELRDGQVSVYDLDPAALGFEKVTLEDLRGGDAAENAGHIRAILSGQPSAMAELTVFNAAAALRICGKAGEWTEAIGAARKSISSGSAVQSLDRLIDFSRNLPA
jgi:anthranilate phosphoribosyltransferase